MPIRHRVLGTWHLHEFTETAVSARTTEHPFGDAPRGLLLHAPDGTMSVQLMNPEAAGYIAYAGTFEVDEDAGDVLHQIGIALDSNWVGSTQVRHVTFSDGGMVLRTTEYSRPDGTRVVGRWFWRRTRPGSAPRR